MGQLSRAVVDGRTGKLLFADAAGTHPPRGREADAANLPKLAGVQIEGRPAQRRSRSSDPGRAPVLIALPQWIRNHYLWTSDAADEEDSVDLGGRRIIKQKTKE